VSAGDAPGDDPPGPTPTVAVGPGARLGRYVLGDELGAGGMATVYRARDPELRRDVAVKVLFPHLAKKADVARRFRREARAAAALEHPNILRVYDVGADDPPYLVMELVRGQSLREIADRDAPLPAELVAAIGALVADALAVAHRARIVHRDVKPANLMLADDGRLLLADFGVARVEDDDALSTKTGALLGTVCFMAPEQAAGGAVDGRSDLFALGVTLYQLAVGALPFTGPPAKIIADAQRGAAVTAARRSSEVGLPLSRVIERLMAPDPAARPADAATAAAELRALVTAGGLGEPRDEVAAFAADRAGYRAARTPTIVAALTRAADAAAARGATASALSACDRILALVPDHAGATALVARLSSRGAWRRATTLGVAGALTAGAVIAGVAYRRVMRDADRTFASHSDAAVDAGAIDAGAIDAGAIDAGAIDAGAIDAGAIDAGPPARRPDAGGAPRPDAAVAALAIDAGLAIDAAARPIDAGPTTGELILALDAWCDLTIDGVARGRASRAPLELTAGRHELICTQGLGLGTWRQTVEVVAGERRTVTGSLVAATVVANGLAHPVRLRDQTLAPGATAEVRPGRVRLDRVQGGAVEPGPWIAIPRVARCTLRDRPTLDCYP